LSVELSAIYYVDIGRTIGNPLVNN